MMLNPDKCFATHVKRKANSSTRSIGQCC